MTTTTLSDDEKRQRFRKVMASFDTAMLVTRTADGQMKSRPLSIARREHDPDRLYFATSVDSPKALELEADPVVHVCMQEKRRFVSLTGRARIVRDRALIDELWAEPMRVWFPKGKDDPSLCIVIVEPSEGAYWDMTGTEGVAYLLEMARAYVTGTKADADDDQRHAARVKL
ncbi:MAG: pyridoxamine 5'-phosphate oxidase family protein [Myxococcales bacterium]|nr:pyridoxamine 5'-phosphate oxidase family protein [Myxococcales bacterium]